MGAVVSPASTERIDRVFVETALFVSFTKNLIAFLPTAGRFARAQNIGDARLWGVEAAVAGRLYRRLTLTGNYTFLHTVQRSDRLSADGKALPGRPQHELTLRADLVQRVGGDVDLGVFADVTFASGNFLDEGNVNEVPARSFVGAGVKLVPAPGVTATVVVRNLFDETVEDVPGPSGSIPRAVADVLGYPLPGRAFYASLDLAF